MNNLRMQFVEVDVGETVKPGILVDRAECMVFASTCSDLLKSSRSKENVWYVSKYVLFAKASLVCSANFAAALCYHISHRYLQHAKIFQ